MGAQYPGDLLNQPGPFDGALKRLEQVQEQRDEIIVGALLKTMKMLGLHVTTAVEEALYEAVKKVPQ